MVREIFVNDCDGGGWNQLKAYVLQAAQKAVMSPIRNSMISSFVKDVNNISRKETGLLLIYLQHKGSE